MLKRLHDLWVRLADIVARRDFEYAELQGSYVALIWSAVLAFEWWRNDLDAANIAGISPIIWAVVFLFIGAAQLYALFRLSYSLRRSSSFLAGCLWSFVAATLGGEWRALLCAMAFALSMASFWGYVRIGRALAMHDAKQAQRAAMRLKTP